MPHHLLTGAGFTRNWGGWLANEAFEYLLGAPDVDEYLRNILWHAKLSGEGFEGALSSLQNEYVLFGKSPQIKQRLDALTQAVIGAAFSRQKFDDQDLRLQRFLARFNSIFTLNQDTFLELITPGLLDGQNAGMARICRT